jgi:hypothetical protein
VSARRPIGVVSKMADTLVKKSKFAELKMYRHSTAKNGLEKWEKVKFMRIL